MTATIRLPTRAEITALQVGIYADRDLIAKQHTVETLAPMLQIVDGICKYLLKVLKRSELTPAEKLIVMSKKGELDTKVEFFKVVEGKAKLKLMD